MSLNVNPITVIQLDFRKLASTMYLRKGFIGHITKLFTKGTKSVSFLFNGSLHKSHLFSADLRNIYFCKLY